MGFTYSSEPAHTVTTTDHWPRTQFSLAPIPKPDTEPMSAPGGMHTPRNTNHHLTTATLRNY